MGRNCCVPNCRGNYDSNSRISAFKFPMDPQRRQQWINIIPRENFAPTSTSYVCADHFDERFVLKTDCVTRPDGSVLNVTRQRPKLTPDAIPTIFNKCPFYMSKPLPVKRKAPDDRRSEVEHRDTKRFTTWMENDLIKDFCNFSNKHSTRAEVCKWITKLYESEGYWSFFYIDSPSSSQPVLLCSIRIFKDLKVEVFQEDIGQVPDSSLKWLLGEIPVLKNWTTFDSLLSHFAGNSWSKQTNNQEKIKAYAGALEKISEEVGDEDKDERERESTKLQFLVDQLKLIPCTKNRYTTETLVFAFKILSMSARVYSMLRDSFLILPHPSYLKKLSSCFKVQSGMNLSGSPHIEYLKQKCLKMEQHERSINLMIDEIHVSQRITYKEGKFEGKATNCNIAEASTAQVFMISSLLSKSKDVVAIVPVKNATAQWLKDTITQVLEMIHSIGYTVVGVISDNNRINRNAFAAICGGTLKCSITNPFSQANRLFFLFDSVHLLKSVRNNWIGQKDVERTFIFPSFSQRDNDLCKASFAHLIKVYNIEKSMHVKIAHKLTQKCINPTSQERQNVRLMLQVFDQNNVFALKHYEETSDLQQDTSGTQKLIQIFLRLWNIFNVRQPYKDIRMRSSDFKAVSSNEDQSVTYLQDTAVWLARWKQLGLKPKEGSLSSETMTALTHTVITFQELIKYLILEKKFKYVLLGKFQTDNLERRFGHYRQLSGGNFHVSVQEILESEKKLKLVSVLKLVSASKGSISLRDFADPLAEVLCHEKQISLEEYQAFLPFLSDIDNEEVHLSSGQLQALVFVSGYCASKILRNNDCDTCKNELSINDKVLFLDQDVMSKAYVYLSEADRGGLTWPSDFVVQTVTEVFKVFQLLIGSANLEGKFLSCKSQRALLLHLSMHRLSDLGMDNCEGNCEQCQTQSKDIVMKFCRTAVNIFLNNYSKSKSDKTSCSNQSRKTDKFKS